MGCVRETLRIKNEANSPHKNEGSLGRVRETPRIKMKAARDVDFANTTLSARIIINMIVGIQGKKKKKKDVSNKLLPQN